MLLYSQQQRNEHIVQEIVFLMALSYNKKVKLVEEPAAAVACFWLSLSSLLGEANNMEIAAILQPGSGWSMETASSSVLKAQKEREREWPLLKLEAPLHSGKLTYLLISAK